MKALLVFLVVGLAGCSTVSFNKNINTEPSQFNKYGMKWERTLQN